MKNFALTLVLGAAIGFGCAKTFDQPAIAESPVSVQELIKAGARIGVAYLNVEEGADLAAFENYLTTDYMPKWQKAYEMTGTGTKAFLTKVVSGEYEGKYGWITIFPDNEAHGLLFSTEGRTELMNNAMEEVGLNMAQPEFPGYVDWTHYGDVNVLATK